MIDIPKVGVKGKIDVPRNENGWPLIGPEKFSNSQLKREAESWASMRGTNYAGGVEFSKYDNELIIRGIKVDYSHIERDLY